MTRYTPREIEALTNWDGMLSKPPFRHPLQKRQYYSRFVSRMLWRSFSEDDWRNVAEIVGEIRVDPKLKLATEFLLKRHLHS